ncbi:hypothetical protein HYS00_00335 [Candidatus Microgenomates bacterium]|nr:hypothetical protein [Candidatus Microgenomates bacterium]
MLERARKFIQVSAINQAFAAGYSSFIGAEIAVVNEITHQKGASLVTAVGLTAIGAVVALEEYGARVKLQEYDKVTRLFQLYGWDKKIVNPMSHTRCERRVVKIASRDCGFEEPTMQYLSSKKIQLSKDQT